jgi:hypothetical protein
MWYFDKAGYLTDFGDLPTNIKRGKPMARKPSNFVIKPLPATVA